MKIQYMSDLHMEFAENSRYLKHNEFPVTGDVLVLAGDMWPHWASSGNGHRQTIARYLLFQATTTIMVIMT